MGAGSSQNQENGLAQSNLNSPEAVEDPDAEVIALSPKSIKAKNRFLCEICNKGFQRDQNLQLHRRGHNLPCKVEQRTNKDVEKVYIRPEKSCFYHNPLKALEVLTRIKMYFSQKHIFLIQDVSVSNMVVVLMKQVQLDDNELLQLLSSYEFHGDEASVNF